MPEQRGVRVRVRVRVRIRVQVRVREMVTHGELARLWLSIKVEEEVEADHANTRKYGYKIYFGCVAIGVGGAKRLSPRIRSSRRLGLDYMLHGSHSEQSMRTEDVEKTQAYAEDVAEEDEVVSRANHFGIVRPRETVGEATRPRQRIELLDIPRFASFQDVGQGRGPHDVSNQYSDHRGYPFYHYRFCAAHMRG